MKISGMPGEYLFKGLIKVQGTQKWLLTEHYYSSIEDLQKSLVGPAEFRWPVEVQEGDILYLPTIGEME